MIPRDMIPRETEDILAYNKQMNGKKLQIDKEKLEENT